VTSDIMQQYTQITRGGQPEFIDAAASPGSHEKSSEPVCANPSLILPGIYSPG
jgi:hypothetical protein